MKRLIISTILLYACSSLFCQYYEKGPLLVSEIMADPSPSVGLPASEYLELYNSSQTGISLEGLSLSTGGSFRPLPPYTLSPGEHLLLCDAEAASALAAFGPVLALEKFPGLANAGDDILFAGPAGDTLVKIHYTTGWYGDPEKAKGGWSLERIDPGAPPGCPANWQASSDPRGGTPGRRNATQGQALETTPPRLLRVDAVSPFELLLTFNEAMQFSAATNADAYSIEPHRKITAAWPQPPDNNQVLLLLGEELEPKTLYRIRAAAPLQDCLGNAIANEPALIFGLSEPLAPADLVINELLFHPQVGGSDFVELYNRSSKILNLEGLQLLNLQKKTGNRFSQLQAPVQLLPGNFLVLTGQPSDILARYAVAHPESLIPLELPTLPAEGGNLTLRFDGLTIDSFDYTPALHSPLLKDHRGVSLERIDPRLPTQDPGNWHSAASTKGYATPASANSQNRTAEPAQGNKILKFQNQTFSPDGDGNEDVLLVRYATDRAGFLLNLRIFDARGRLVRTLATNYLLATQGQLKWDGTTRNGQKAAIGIYIFLAELFTPEGRTLREKATAVLAGKLSP